MYSLCRLYSLSLKLSSFHHFSFCVLLTPTVERKSPVCVYKKGVFVCLFVWFYFLVWPINKKQRYIYFRIRLDQIQWWNSAKFKMATWAIWGIIFPDMHYDPSVPYIRFLRQKTKTNKQTNKQNRFNLWLVSNKPAKLYNKRHIFLIAQ